MEGGEARPLTDLPKGASGPRVVARWPQPSRFLPPRFRRDFDKKEGAKRRAMCSVITRAVYRFNGAGYLEAGPSQPYLDGRSSQSPRRTPRRPKQVTSGEFSENEIVWSRDGSQIYFTSRARAGVLLRNAAHRSVRRESHRRRDHARSPAWTGEIEQYVAEPGWNAHGASRLDRSRQGRRPAILQPAGLVHDVAPARFHAEESHRELRLRYRAAAWAAIKARHAATGLRNRSGARMAASFTSLRPKKAART